jgi:hypothetical protein
MRRHFEVKGKAMRDLTTNPLAIGDKITVISTDARRDGFTRHDGIFRGYKLCRHGAPFIAKYDWMHLAGDAWLDKVEIRNRDHAARLW